MKFLLPTTNSTPRGFSSRRQMMPPRVVIMSLFHLILVEISTTNASWIRSQRHVTRMGLSSCLHRPCTPYRSRPYLILPSRRPVNIAGRKRIRTFASSSESPATGSSSKSSAVSSGTFDQELLDLRRTFEEALALCEKNRQSMALDIPKLELILRDLEREQSQDDFWDEENARRAATVNQLFSLNSRLLSRLREWQRWQDDGQAALEMLLSSTQSSSALLSSEEREMLVHELRETSTKWLDDSRRYELELLLSGPYDQAPARIVLTAGAGGTEANDWVADLKRMYERHAENMGFTCVVEDAQEGDMVGYKSVDMLITGPNAYGWFQGEKGAHRLVRLSPFNANNKRQTTFAGVDVAPEVLNEDDLKDIDIPEADLEITTMRSGGKGGQNVNKVNSAVRIKHLPSGLQVKCTQERSQVMNKDLALKRLKAQLLAIAQEQRVQQYQQIRGDMVEASWGAQIRNYVLHPYKLVKDQRTGWETSQAQSFLDGELLDECIGAYLRYKAAKEKEEQASANP